MSDEEIRDLLDLGAEEFEFGPPIEAEGTWVAGRRSRSRSHAWGAGLGAVAAAAGVVGIVWAQGLGGGEAETPPPPADGTLTAPQPTLTSTEQGRGEPYLAMFHRAGDPVEHSGASEPATVADLQGTWVGPDGEEFVFADDQLTATFGGCTVERGEVSLSPDSRLVRVGDWESTEHVGDCSTEAPLVFWGSALHQAPLLSLDGETLVISGLDGTSDERRVPASLTVTASDEEGLIWEDVEPAGEGSPAGGDTVVLGEDFQLMVSGDTQDLALTSISELNLESPGQCGQVMTASLRSDGILLAGDPAPWPVCTEGEDALPPAEPSPSLLALFRSGPTVSFEDGTMTISGTVPESLAQSTPPPDDGATTSAPTDGGAPTTAPENDPENGQGPPVSGANPEVVGVPQAIVMSEGDWSPSGELAPLTAEQATGKGWLPVTTDSVPPEVGADLDGERGLSFDGDTWHIRDCGIDITVPGGLEDGLLTTTGEPEVVPDPDPGAACVFPLTPEDWQAVLTGEPSVAVDGEILVIRAGLGDVPLEPAGMALVPDGVSDPSGGPVSAVSADDLAAGLTELSAEQAAGEVGVSDLRDPQPEHASTVSMAGGVVTVDVGCAEPLTGPAWFSHVGPEEHMWQLTAALPEDPDCAGPAAQEAELWRQMLAHGAFLHRFGDYVIVDAWADPGVSGPVVTP